MDAVFMRKREVNINNIEDNFVSDYKIHELMPTM